MFPSPAASTASCVVMPCSFAARVRPQLAARQCVFVQYLEPWEALPFFGWAQRLATPPRLSPFGGARGLERRWAGKQTFGAVGENANQ